MLTTHKLTKPITVDDEEIKELTFDFASQTGADLMKIELEMKMENLGTIGIDNTHFLMRIAAKAANVFPDTLLKIPAGDYMEIYYLTRNFILGYGAKEVSEDLENSSGDSENNNAESNTGSEKA